MKGRSALIFALMAVAIVAIAGTSNACVSPEDRYSVEVLLNKPGLSYDLSILKNAENVVDVNPELIGVSGEVVVYKSHYHEDLAAILYESSIETGGEKMQKYLSVRLTPRVHEVTEYRYKTKAQISKTEFEPHQNFSNLTTPEELQIPGWTIKQSGVGYVGDKRSYYYSAEYKENGNWIKINFFPPQRTGGGIEIDIETNKELNEELKNEILNVSSSMFYLGKPDFQKITDALHCTITSKIFGFNQQQLPEDLNIEKQYS